MVAQPDDSPRRLEEISDLLASIESHAENARLESPGLNGVHAHVSDILSAATRLREQLLPAGGTENGATVGPRERERVLLVEDDQQVRQLLTRTLERLGYDVKAAENGRAALDALDACERGPDILVTDVVMPKLGGRELAIRLRLRDPNLKVLFVSGYSHGALDARLLRRPGTAFLQKPFTPRDLGRALTDLLNRETAKRA